MARAFLSFLVLLCVLATSCAKAPMVTVTTKLAELAPLVPDPQPTTKPVVELHGDTTFDADERKTVELAAKLWRLQTSNVAVITLVWDVDFASVSNLQEHVNKHHHTLLKTVSWAEDVREQDRPNSFVLAFVYPRGGIHNPWGDAVTMKLVMDRLDDTTRMFQVTVHEFGHVFGVPHLESVQSVMFPAYFPGKTSCLKRHDLVAFCNVNECGSAQMFPCE